MSKGSTYEAIVIGTSAGGLMALTAILNGLSEDYSIPVIIVQHRAKDSQDLFEDVLQQKCRIRIKQADEKERIEAGFAYTAPPDYHLLIESDKTFSLTTDPPVQFSRPSIDVLFESAAMTFRDKLIGIILTGSNQDGSEGIATIRRLGGLTIAQDPEEAQYSAMPQAAINREGITHVWPVAAIARFLKDCPHEFNRER
jgi:two-component system chemotaxis response regulator CheB